MFEENKTNQLTFSVPQICNLKSTFTALGSVTSPLPWLCPTLSPHMPHDCHETRTSVEYFAPYMGLIVRIITLRARGTFYTLQAASDWP